MQNREVIISGGFGFIGSNLVAELNRRDITPYVIDSWKETDHPLKWRNVRGLRFERITVDDLDECFELRGATVVALGASVDTTESMSEALWENNVTSLLNLRKLAGRFIYASSGAVYGTAETDFSERLNPRAANPYAATKLYVDDHFFGGESAADTYGLRFFNVYGPRETAKGDMASLVTKGLMKKGPLWSDGYRYIPLSPGSTTGTQYGDGKPYWSLFEHPAGPIERDFVFVGDVVSVILHFIEAADKAIAPGLYNVGTGQSQSFESLVKAVENLPIEYVPLPDKLKGQYQRITRANVNKLREVAGYVKPFTGLVEGVEKTRSWMKEEGII